MRAFVLLICLGLVIYIGCTLVYMAQVRGWLRGAAHVTCTVTDKWVVARPFCEPACMVRWTTRRHVSGVTQLEISRRRWTRLVIGKPLELVRTPNGVLHLRRDLFDSNARFVFYLLALALTLWLGAREAVRMARGKQVVPLA